MTMRYQYDLWATSGARGRARLDHLDRILQDHTRPDPPVPEHIKKSLANFITKTIKSASDHKNRRQNLSEYNTGYCKPCRRIFDGIGNYTLSLSGGDGLYYTHWDARYLEKSAMRGCSLCLLLYRKLGVQRLPLTCGEVLPAQYDCGSFDSEEHIYALRFFYYAVLREGDEFVPINLAGVTITLQEASTIRPLTDGTLMSSSTQSQESLSQVLKWLHSCNTSHSCRTTQSSGATLFLPTRLIDVSTASGPGCVRLVDSKSIPPDSRYATLSHCWGPSPSVSAQLNHQSEPSYREAIPLHHLPKTIMDAIVVTRNLGLRYIWIDFLCILQHNERDWREQAAMMGEVYSMSYLTISATASSNSTEGLFRKRPSSTTKPCSATVGEGHNLFAPGEYCCYDDGEWSRYVNEAPLSKRAWVYQERLLSPRIVHFAEDQIFWECRQVRASEGFPSSIPPRYDIGTRRLVPSLEEREEQTRFLEVWDSIVKAYTSGILTYNSDKLTAVLALAKELSHSSSRAGTYLAGLWKGPIVDQLLWSASNSTVRSPVYRAPTWSWASMDGPISPRFNWSDIGPDGEKQTSRKMVEVLDATVVPKQGPFDTVSSGVLRLSGPLLKFNLLPNNKPTKTVSDDLPEESMEFTISAERGHIGVDDSSNENPPFGPRGFYMPLYEHSEAKGRLDDDRSLDDPQDFFFMPLLSFNDYYRGSDEEAAEISSIQGLILEPAKTQTGQYKRCGICSVSEYDAAKLFCALGNQDPEQLQFEALASRKLTLDEFLPPNWSGKSLDFIPKEFDCYVISII